MKYGTIKWFERYMAEVVVSVEVVSFHPVVGVVGAPCFLEKTRIIFLESSFFFLDHPPPFLIVIERTSLLL